MGGPVWHASGRGATVRESRRLARLALSGVGIPGTDREFDGESAGIVHAQRRLTDEERAAFGIGDLVDVRGTAEERAIIDAVMREAPYLRAYFGG